MKLQVGQKKIWASVKVLFCFVFSLMSRDKVNQLLEELHIKSNNKWDYAVLIGCW